MGYIRVILFLLPYAHSTQANCYRKSSFKQWKKLKIKKAILTHSSGPQRNFKQLFLGAKKPKIVARVHCAYVSKDKMIRTWPKFKKKLFQPSSPLPIETSWHKNNFKKRSLTRDIRLQTSWINPQAPEYTWVYHGDISNFYKNSHKYSKEKVNSRRQRR